MTLIEFWTSGATDVFGHRFRDAWHVVGWEEGRVSERYVCWLHCDWEPRPVKAIKPVAAQMDLF